MAQKTLIVLEDDVDGSEAAETVQFGIDGSTYEIDLSDKNAAKLRKAIEGFVNAARRTRSSRKSPSRSSASIDNKAVRAWAQSNGLQVSERGRISADVVEKYRAAGH